MAIPKKKETQRKLTREEKKQLNAIIERTNEKGKKPYTAQATIPYLRMWPDGVCQVTENHFTKTIQFQDINYQLAQNEDKTAIFEGWCDFLNYFDASIQFQFSFLNLAANAETFEQSVMIPYKEDGFDNIREEYADMLHNQLTKGNNGLTKTKFITFGIDADSIRTAKPRLERVEIDLLNNFKRLGVAAEALDGKSRLQLLHGIFHMDTQEKFMFEWRWLPLTGLSTKDFIAPSSFDFSDSRSYRMGEKYATTSFLQIMAPELNDRMLADFLAMDSSLIATMHIHSIDQTEAIKTIKRKITDLDKSKIDEQKKAVRAGYDIDIIPSDLATYGSEAKKLLEDLQSRNERMFLLTFLLTNTADTKRQLKNILLQAKGIAQKYNCQITTLDFQQEDAMVSSLPLGLNKIQIQRGLTTSSTAIFVPFTTQELFQSGGESLYYGLNALSNNLIMVDRKKLKNPNGLILGTPGSGKSFAAKREIANAFLLTDDDIIVCDPEGEYFPLCEMFKGQVIRISPTSGDYINPMQKTKLQKQRVESLRSELKPDTPDLPQEEVKPISDNLLTRSKTAKGKTTPTKTVLKPGDAPQKPTRLSFEPDLKSPHKGKGTQPVTRAISNEVHKALRENTDGDIGAEAADTSLQTSESTLRFGNNAHHRHELRKYRKAEHAERQVDKANIRFLQKKDELQHIDRNLAEIMHERGLGQTKEAETPAKEPDKETSFQEMTGDGYLIYQLREDAGNVKFASLEQMKSQGIAPDRSLYEPVYVAPLESGDKTLHEHLNDLYKKFNIDHPADFTGHSMSVSDVVALKLNGKVSYYFVDSFDFQKLDRFMTDNPLKNAEMSVEDDYGMIDGIINNGKAPALEAAEAKPKAMPSLKDQLSQAKAQAEHQPRTHENKQKKGMER